MQGSATSSKAPRHERNRERPLTRRYWERMGGTLLEEYLVVRPRPGVSPRWVDGIIILGGDHRIASHAEHAHVSLDGHDLIAVQTKTGRLGMYLLGQALFSRELIRECSRPRSVRTVALCGRDDHVLHPTAEYFGIEVVVDDLAARSRTAVGQFPRFEEISAGVPSMAGPRRPLTESTARSSGGRSE